MNREKLNKLLKKADLSKKELAKITNLAYSTINNWGASQNVPHWVESWLDNYIRAKSSQELLCNAKKFISSFQDI